MARHWTKAIRRKAGELLDLPPDLVLGLPRIIMIGNRQLTIENHRGVDHFGSGQLRLKLDDGKLELSGEDLVIRAIWKNEVLVEGVIREIRYVT